MKTITFATIYILSALFCKADLSLPPDIIKALSESNPGESGGLIVNGAEKKRFYEYIGSNWKKITDNIEELPKAQGDYFTEKDAYNASVIIFGIACEWLPPEEYMEFLSRFTDLMEQNKVDYKIWNSQLSGCARKDYFLMVNWYHPSVKKLIVRAKKIIPEDDPETLAWLNDLEAGKFADSYLANKSDDAPLPETLPGVKLERPFASLISKYERLTGKKVPPDPRFPEETETRPLKRSADGIGDINSTGSSISLLWDYAWLWLLVIGAFATTTAFILRTRRNKRQMTC